MKIAAMAIGLLALAGPAHAESKPASLTPQDTTDIELLYANTAAAEDAGGRTRHMITNLLLEPSDKGATGIAYAIIITDAHPRPDGRLNAISAMVQDELVKTQTGWRFATRHVWNDQDPATPFRNKHCIKGKNNCLASRP